MTHTQGEAVMADLVAWLREQLYTASFTAKQARTEWPEGDAIALEVKSILCGAHIVRNEPREVLAQCDADAVLLDRWREARDEYSADGRTWDHDSEVGRARTAALEEAVRVRATAYQHHEGYRDEWRP